MRESILQRLIIHQLRQLDRDHFGAGFVKVNGLRKWRAERIRVYRRNIVKATALNRDGSFRHIKAGEPGQADLYGVLTVGRKRFAMHMECEVKRPGEVRTPEQLAWAEDQQRAGVLYVVAFCVEDALAPVRAALGIDAQ